MAPTTVLITGGNRGLGQGLVKRYLAQPNHTVIAATRDPTHHTSQALSSLPKGSGSSLILVKYDASIEQDAFAIVDELQKKHGIQYLDVVIPNAGVAKSFPLAKDVKGDEVRAHVEVNVLGTIWLYQATRNLLQQSTMKAPILALMGSGAGCLGRQPAVPNSAYGVSKAMVHWYGVRINAEDEWLNTFVLDPGFVQTDMGQEGARIFGMEEAPVTVDDSVDGMFGVLTTATKERVGGRVVLYTGEIVEY